VNSETVKTTVHGKTREQEEVVYGLKSAADILDEFLTDSTIDIESSKIDCLRFVVCPLLAQLITGFFSSFSAAAIHSTNEANKAGGMCH
jgi:hypothetical protein